MKKQNIFLLILLSLVLTTGCTSKKVDQEEGGDAAELSEDAAVNAEDSAEGGEDVAELSDDFGGDEAESAEGASEDVAASEAPAESTESTDELAGLDDSAAPAETTEIAEAAPEESAPSQELATNDTASSENLDSAMGDTASAEDTQGLTEEAPKPVIPLQKMMTTPFTKNGVLLNALYVARPGDTTESVAMKIYGQDKSQELKDNNATLARRNMKVGDKVYYNSPQRPTDSTQILTYYEDMGLAPEIYLSKADDNIRTVSKNILGDENSWKEIWSTNLDVESKDALPEGTRLRYWPAETSVSAPIVAANTAPAPTESAPPVEQAPPPMPDQAMSPPPPTMDQAAPPPPDMAMAEPPPPAAAEISAPPPSEPPPPVADAGMDAGADVAAEDPDQMMALGAGAILLIAAVALFIIIRKKRSRREGIDFQTATHTQIE